MTDTVLLSQRTMNCQLILISGKTFELKFKILYK